MWKTVLLKKTPHLPDEKYCNKESITPVTIMAVPEKTVLSLQLFLVNYLWFLGSELIEGINK